MRALPAAAVLAAVSLSPAAAQAPAAQPFDLFQRVCLSTAADLGRVTASPDLKGWMNVPLPMDPKIENGRILDKAVRVKHEGRDRLAIVFVARGELTRDGRKIPFVNCSLGMKPADRAQAVSRIRAWSGVAPMDLPKGLTAFRWSEKNGVRTSVPTAKKVSDLADLPAGSRAASIDVKVERDTLLISYTIPKL